MLARVGESRTEDTLRISEPRIADDTGRSDRECAIRSFKCSVVETDDSFAALAGSAPTFRKVVVQKPRSKQKKMFKTIAKKGLARPSSSRNVYSPRPQSSLLQTASYDSSGGKSKRKVNTSKYLTTSGSTNSARNSSNFLKRPTSPKANLNTSKGKKSGGKKRPGSSRAGYERVA